MAVRLLSLRLLLLMVVLVVVDLLLLLLLQVTTLLSQVDPAAAARTATQLVELKKQVTDQGNVVKAVGGHRQQLCRLA